MSEWRHKCRACRLRWPSFGYHGPDASCPFCGAPTVTAHPVGAAIHQGEPA